MQGRLIRLGLVIRSVNRRVGWLMVSNVPYRSFKELDPSSKVPFIALAAVVVVYALISLDPPRVLLLIAIIYAFSGPVETGLKYLKGNQG